MLYLIGGAARAGKSSLALALLARDGIPFFSLDYLAMGLANGLPDGGFDPDAACIPRAEKLWTVAKPLCVNIVEANTPSYCIEGDALLPVHAAEMAERFPECTRTCFLGYPHADPRVKLAEIRRLPSALNDWVQDLSDAEILELVAEMIEFSGYLEGQCARLRLPFIDVGAEYPEAIERARETLLGEGKMMEATPD